MLSKFFYVTRLRFKVTEIGVFISKWVDIATYISPYYILLIIVLGGICNRYDIGLNEVLERFGFGQIGRNRQCGN